MCAVGFSVPNTVMGIFMQPMKETLNESATSVTLFYTFYNIAAISAAIFGPRLIKNNAPLTIMICACVTGFSLVLIGAMQSISTLWIASIFIGLTTPIASILSVSIIIPNWFKDAGTPIGAAMAFVGLGTAIIAPITQSIMDSGAGWRLSIMGLGIAYVVIIGICGLALIRYSPSDYSPGDGDGRRERRVGSAEEILDVKGNGVFKSPTFYLLMAALVIVGFAGSFNTQSNIIIQNSGFDTSEAAYAVSSASLGLVIGKILLGVISDRFTSVVAGFLSALFILVGLIGMLYSFATGLLVVLIISMFVAGMGFCAGTIMAPLYTMDTFGPEEYSTIYGTMSIGNNIGLIIASPIVSAFFDMTGSYFGAMVAFMVAAVLFSFGGLLAVKSGQRSWKQQHSLHE